MNALDAPRGAQARLKSPLAVVAARPSKRAGWEVLESLGFAGKHLDTLTLDAVRDTAELALGNAGLTTVVAGRHFVRRLLERPRGLEQKLLKTFPLGVVVVARAWERGYGYALYEQGQKLRHRVYALGELLVDEGELLDEEEGLYDGPEFDHEGLPLDDDGAVERGSDIARALLARVYEGDIRAVEMDLYEGPPR